jgi:ribose 5-phosphate isomerase B
MTRRRLITEREIARASKAGDKSIDVAGAMVTPSARDAATRAGISLTGAGKAGPPPAPARKPTGSDAPRAGAKPVAAPEAKPDGKSGSKPDSKALTVALGADHGGLSLKLMLSERLRELGHTVKDFGTATSDPVDYPDYAVKVAGAVASGTANFGVMVDGAGIGSCMAANKVRGARAAMCHDVTTAVNAREHNNANVLTLGGGLIGPRLATVILETFLATPFAGGRHAARVGKIDALDRPG